jgi:tight adherence protein C
MSFSASPLLAAAAPLQSVPQVLACVLIGVAVFVLMRTITNTLHTDDMEQDDDWRYDVNRINELRRTDFLYRYFQPVIQLFARFNRGAFRDSLPEMGREIQAAGLPRFWTPAEYLGRIELIALLISPLFIMLCIRMMELPGIVLGLVLTVLAAWLLRRNLASRARYRLLLIKRRLPFLLDLLTLLMEAGSTFIQALKDAVQEFQHHPVGHEFGRVLAEMSMGKSRTAALEALRDRLSDDEITSIIGSIIQGENLGTPLARLFRTQADVLRMKRTQRAETVAGEAGVQMLLPGILIMASTVIIILGPFILGFIYAEFM